MANDTKPTPSPATIADLAELVKALQSNQEKLAATLAEGIKAGMQSGMQMAAMAREGMDPVLANARAARQSLGAMCHKCRMPMKVCGGPEMKLVPKLDAKGEPVMKDGKPEMVRSTTEEATKPNAEDANHVKMVVRPGDQALARWFQWIGINGVKFVSKRHGQAILVPRKNDFAHILNEFSRFEADFRQSRKVKFNQGARWAPKPIHFAGKGSPLGPRMVS